MKQSAKLQLFNYLYEQFSDLDVPVIETKDLNQELSYPFIAIQTVSDDVNRKTFDSFSGNPTATVHIWGVDENKGVNDALYLKVQAILLEDIELDGFSLFNPQMTVNEIIENESNLSLIHISEPTRPY